MEGHSQLVQEARSLPKDRRQAAIMSFPETELHKHLKALFQKMEPNYRIAITHGSDELGKDLVIVKHDKLGTDVTAIVVKIGNIRGTTAGDVDGVRDHVNHILSKTETKKLQEIESQVLQASEHPAKLTSLFKELPVNKVLVIVAGEFSTQA